MAKDDKKTEDEKTETQKLPFPKAVFFIIGTELCERLNYFGFMAILTIYLHRIVGFTENEATVIFHTFIVLMYIFTISGAIISDNWLGRYRTIFYLAIVYGFGQAVLTFGTIPPARREFILPGLVIIAVAAGGIKTNINPFGGDQFQLPEQKDQLMSYFAIFYWIVNVGSFSATFLIPIVRSEVHCFGDLHCYPLAFGLPMICMFTAVVIFIIGRPLYKIVPQKSNILVEVVKAIGHAIANRRRSNEKREHWLDYADDKYDKQLIADVKAVLRILVLYIPLPLFWSLFDQLGSRWVLQAARMNGEVGSWNILPEQIGLLNPIIILILIPLSNYILYPPLRIVGIRSHLQKMCLGGIVLGIAYIMAAILEFQLEKTYPILPEKNNAQLRIFNGESCNYDVTTNIKGQEKFVLKSLDVYTYKNIDVPDGKFELTYSISSTDPACPVFTTKAISIPEETAYSIFLSSKNTAHPITDFKDNVDKAKSGLPFGRVLANIKGSSKIHWKDIDHGSSDTDLRAHEHELKEVTKGKHAVFVDGKKVAEVETHLGGSYTIIVNEKADGTYAAQILIITEANSIHMFWTIPQYIVFTTAEILYSVTGLQFNYSQAPLSMKSVVTAVWYLTVCCGNIITALIAGLHLMKQSYEFLLFSLLIFIAMGIFAFLANRYKYHDPTVLVP